MRMPPSPTTHLHLRVALSVTVAGVTALILAGCSHSSATTAAAGQSVTQSRSSAAVPASAASGAASGAGPGKPLSPLFGMASYAWGGEKFAVDSITVPKALEGVTLTLHALGGAESRGAVPAVPRAAE